MTWWAMTTILLALWGLGLVSGAQLGGWVHLFFGLAACSALLGLMQGARPRSQPTRRGLS